MYTTKYIEQHHMLEKRTQFLQLQVSRIRVSQSSGK